MSSSIFFDYSRAVHKVTDPVEIRKHLHEVQRKLEELEVKVETVTRPDSSDIEVKSIDDRIKNVVKSHHMTKIKRTPLPSIEFITSGMYFDDLLKYEDSFKYEYICSLIAKSYRYATVLAPYIGESLISGKQRDIFELAVRNMMATNIGSLNIDYYERTTDEITSILDRRIPFWNKFRDLRIGGDLIYYLLKKDQRSIYYTAFCFHKKCASSEQDLEIVSLSFHQNDDDKDHEDQEPRAVLHVRQDNVCSILPGTSIKVAGVIPSSIYELVKGPGVEMIEGDNVTTIRMSPNIPYGADPTDYINKYLDFHPIEVCKDLYYEKHIRVLDGKPTFMLPPNLVYHLFGHEYINPDDCSVQALAMQVNRGIELPDYIKSDQLIMSAIDNLRNVQFF